MNKRVLVQASLSPGLAKQIEELAEKECDSNISEYIKRALRFYANFGLNNERFEKLKDGSEKENRTLDNMVTAILTEHLDKVRYFKSFS